MNHTMQADSSKCYIQVYEKQPERESICFVDPSRLSTRNPAQSESAAPDSNQLDPQPSVPPIFSKAKEFGADENNLSKKLEYLENMLHSYNGLGDMKDDFAKMMYATQSNIVMPRGTKGV